jgi:hypothetical protein
VRKVLIIGVTVVMLLAGCGEESEKADSTESPGPVCGTAYACFAST